MSGNTQNITTAGHTYIFVRAISNTGLASDVSNYRNSYIDTIPTAPVISINSSSWVTTSHTITITSRSNAGSGIDHYEYGIGTTSTYPSSSKSFDNTSFTYSEDGSNVIYVRAISIAGNIGEWSNKVTSNIDKGTPDKPSITASDNKASDTWHSSTFSLVLTGGSNNTVKSSITYKYSTNGTSYTSISGQSISVSTNTASTTYYVKACTQAGVCSEEAETYIVKLDTNIPSVTVTDGGSSKIKVTVSNIGVSGLVSYCVNKSAESTTDCTWTNNTSSSFTTNAVSNSGNYYVHTKTGAGIISHSGGIQIQTILCKRATSLHTETCNVSSSGYGCRKGFKKGDTITYGSLGTSGKLTTGDAFDCDVNGDGIYNSTNERFYYVSDLFTSGIYSSASFNSNYAVLIYYSNVLNGVATSYTSSGVYYNSSISSPGSNGYKSGPVEAAAAMPSTSQWVTSIVTLNQYIYNASSGKYAVTRSAYTGKAARLLTQQEISKGCGCGKCSTNKSLTSCNFLFENTRYAYGTASGTTGIRLDDGSFTEYDDVNWSTASAAVQTTKGARPAIEVEKTKISY